MEEGFWFKSDLFQIQPREDEETNPGCYGKELGNWLCNKFKELGYEVEDLIAEDWGWCVMCYSRDFLLWVGCGSMMMDNFPDNYDPESPPSSKDVVWHVFPVVEVPFFFIRSRIKKLVGKLDTKKPIKKLRDELKSVLDEEPRIEFCESP